MLSNIFFLRLLFPGFYRFALATFLLFISFFVLDAAMELILHHSNETVPAAAQTNRGTR